MIGGFEADPRFSRRPNRRLGVVEAYEQSASGSGEDRDGESVAGADVVVLYAAHFTHDLHEEDVGHVVGPMLRPVRW